MRILQIVLLVAGLGLSTPTAARQQPDEPAKAQTTEEKRQAALNWLDEYLGDTVLFTKADLEALRDKVKRMTPSQLQQWIDRTTDIREALESEKWQATNQWAKEFLRVQAIYSDEEIKKMREDAAKMTPDELLGLMSRLEERHEQIAWMHNVSEANRLASLQSNQATIKQQAAAPTPRTSNRPLFGGSESVDVGKRYAGRGVPPPLIDSRSVARRAAWQQVYPLGFYWW